MLLIKTVLAQSSIEGIGLFTVGTVPKGHGVWKQNEMTTLAWTKSEWENLKGGLPDTAFENMSRFAYYRYGKWLLNLDDSRFMNHSENPNLVYDKENDACYALRDINAGEELTVRYSAFCDESDDSICLDCGLCNSKNSD